MNCKYIYIIAISFFLIVEVACNKESLIESTSTTDDSGTITLYGTSTYSCGATSAYVDDKLVGKFTSDANTTPKCGAATTGSVITVSVGEGFHTIRIVGNKSSCNKTISNVWVTKGQCTSVPLL